MQYREVWNQAWSTNVVEGLIRSVTSYNIEKFGTGLGVSEDMSCNNYREVWNQAWSTEGLIRSVRGVAV